MNSRGNYLNTVIIMYKNPAYNYSARSTLKLIKESRGAYWAKKREINSLDLFHRAASQVPAYKKFLKKHNVNQNEIRTWRDFQALPQMNKENYLRKYKLNELVWEGSLKQPLVFTATSGSTGEPVYFVRNQQLDWQYSVILENFIKEGMKDKPGPVLIIISFGMGLWIGGIITYKAFELAAQRSNLPVSIITPGINKREIINSLRRLSSHYGQTIIVGYPPFVKDVIDEAPEQGIDIDKLNIRMLFAAEAITEEFRDYVAEKTKMKSCFVDTMNIYGSADIGAMAYETGVSILVKRLAMKTPELFKDIFNDIYKTPTLAQFNPLYISFEEVDKQLLLTGNSAMPLVRYAIGDNGGVFSYDDLVKKMRNHGTSLDKELKKVGIDKNVAKLPFVYVYERKDFSVKLHLRDIYPQIIKDALLSPGINEILTGKFTMTTKYNARQNQYLELNLEERKGRKVSREAADLIKKTILKALYLKTDGPGDPNEFVKRPNLLKLVFWPAEYPLHFATGIKQEWVKKA